MRCADVEGKARVCGDKQAYGEKRRLCRATTSFQLFRLSLISYFYFVSFDVPRYFRGAQRVGCAADGFQIIYLSSLIN